MAKIQIKVRNYSNYIKARFLFNILTGRFHVREHCYCLTMTNKSGLTLFLSIKYLSGVILGQCRMQYTIIKPTLGVKRRWTCSFT